MKKKLNNPPVSAYTREGAWLRRQVRTVVSGQSHRLVPSIGVTREGSALTGSPSDKLKWSLLSSSSHVSSGLPLAYWV